MWAPEDNNLSFDPLCDLKNLDREKEKRRRTMSRRRLVEQDFVADFS